MRRAVLWSAVAGALLLAASGCGDTAAEGEAQAAAAPASILFVQGSDSAHRAGDRLVLAGVSRTTSAFSDRPDRISTAIETAAFVDLFAELFAADPPNATLSTSADAQDYVVALSAPRYDRATDELSYEISTVEGSRELPSRLGPVSVFIDNADLPALSSGVYGDGGYISNAAYGSLNKFSGLARAPAQTLDVPSP